MSITAQYAFLHAAKLKNRSIIKLFVSITLSIVVILIFTSFARAVDLPVDPLVNQNEELFDISSPVVIRNQSDFTSFFGFLNLNVTVKDELSPVHEITYELLSDDIVIDNGVLETVYGGGSYDVDGEVSGVINVDTHLYQTGDYVVRICASDLEGNVGLESTFDTPSELFPCQLFDVYIDNQKPVLNPISQKSVVEMFEGMQFPLVEVSAIDDSEVVAIQFELTNPDDSQDYFWVDFESQPAKWDFSKMIWGADTNTLIDTTVLVEGNYSVIYRFYDVNGNVSEDYTLTFEINNVVPKVYFQITSDAVEKIKMSFSGSFEDTSCILEKSVCVNSSGVPDDGPWTVTVDYGDNSATAVYTQEIEAPGELIIPDHVYEIPGDYIAKLMICEATSETSENQCAEAILPININKPQVVEAAEEKEDVVPEVENPIIPVEEKTITEVLVVKPNEVVATVTVTTVAKPEIAESIVTNQPSSSPEVLGTTTAQTQTTAAEASPQESGLTVSIDSSLRKSLFELYWWVAIPFVIVILVLFFILRKRSKS